MKVEYLDHMGDDLAVVNDARVSFDKKSGWVQRRYDPDSDDLLPGEFPAEYEPYENWPLWRDEEGYKLTGFLLSEKDAKLIRYLARNGHWTPFAHSLVKLRITAPIAIRTQCFKHKVGFVENEVSRRYVDAEPEIFFPEYWRKRANHLKQGSLDEPVEEPLRTSDSNSTTVQQAYVRFAEYAKDLYREMIDHGVCPEQARFVLPQGTETTWIWTGSLAAWARFYKQRTDPHAQKEIQDLAKMIGEKIKPLFPVSWAALTE